MSRSSLVREVMTTDVLTFGPEENVQDAMRALVDRGVDGGPVLDASGAVIGVLTTSDLIVKESKVHVPTLISVFGAYLELPSAARKLDDDLEKALGSTVGEVMEHAPVTIGPDETVEAAATSMHTNDVSRLPVVEAGHLVGIIARADIVRAIITTDGPDQ